MGHSKVDITLDTYSHVLPSMQKDAVNKLENLFEKNKNDNEEKSGVVIPLTGEQK